MTAAFLSSGRLPEGSVRFVPVFVASLLVIAVEMLVSVVALGRLGRVVALVLVVVVSFMVPAAALAAARDMQVIERGGRVHFVHVRVDQFGIVPVEEIDGDAFAK